MSFVKSVEIAAEINNSNSDRNGHIISWRSLVWLLPLEALQSNESFVDYWQEHSSWLHVCQESGLDISQNISARANRQTGEFWVSIELMAAVAAKSWEIPNAA